MSLRPAVDASHAASVCSDVFPNTSNIPAIRANTGCDKALVDSDNAKDKGVASVFL